ncbi:MAG: hypothetical protein ACD_81C00168G0002 [uncultured bacterium]|nr:MAG: hypothetical protein ACD_81C00168G0002 [uncultured bacterium]
MVRKLISAKKSMVMIYAHVGWNAITSTSGAIA